MAEVRARGLERTALILGVVALLSCGGSTEPTDARLTATLTGSHEVPPNNSKAEGSAVITLVGRRLTYTITGSGLSAPVILGNIHVGSPGTVGPIIVPFTIAGQAGTIASGEVDLSQPVSYNTLTLSGDSLRALVVNGYTYVNLFTSSYPGGEIRGQILR
jgi:hypothetical protein